VTPHPGARESRVQVKWSRWLGEQDSEFDQGLGILAGDRQVRGLTRVHMGLEAVDNMGGGDLPKFSVLQRPTPHIAGQVNVPKRASSSCGL